MTSIHGKTIQINKYIEFLRSRGFVISNSFFTQVLIQATMEYEKSFSYSKTYRVTRAQEVASASTDFMMHLYDEFQKKHPPRVPFSLRDKIKKIDDDIDKWYQGLSKLFFLWKFFHHTELSMNHNVGTAFQVPYGPFGQPTKKG